MAESDSHWLEVIGRALAYLCVQQASVHEPKRVADVPSKVAFLESIGMDTADAAKLMGTTANSVKTNLRIRAKRSKTVGKAKR